MRSAPVTILLKQPAPAGPESRCPSVRLKGGISRSAAVGPARRPCFWDVEAYSLNKLIVLTKINVAA
jgi:hypothetical protein